MQQHQNLLVNLLNEYPKACRVLLGILLMGSVSLASHKLTDGNSLNQSQIIDFPEIEEIELDKPEDSKAITECPQPKNLILIPETEKQLDCVRGGGGSGCFDSDYKPNYPTSQKPKKPRNILYRFW